MINNQNKASEHGVIFSYDSNTNTPFNKLLQSHVKIAPCPWDLRIVGWKTEYLNDWMKLYERLNNCTVTGYRIGIYEKTGIIKFETKVYQWYCLAAKSICWIINFELKSHKTADFMKIVLAVCRLVRYREKYGEKEKKCFCKFQISKKTMPTIYNIKFFRLIQKSRF